MGIIDNIVMQATSISDVLFTRTQQKVLGLLFGYPNRRFYTNEIMRHVAMGRGTVSRELDKLLSAELVTVTRQGNQNYYQANPDSPVYSELVAIASKTLKDNNTLFISDKLSIKRETLKKLAQSYHIQRLVLFGSAARGELNPGSDIDLLVEFEKDKAPSLGGMVKLNDEFVSLFGGHKVDLATPNILNNPYRKRVIEKDMEELYAA